MRLPCRYLLPFLFLLQHTFALSIVQKSSVKLKENTRRAFLKKATGAVLSSSFVPFSIPVEAADVPDKVTQAVKVTAVAHTFITSTGNKASVKPIRENDATRFFTNARILHLFYTGDEEKAYATTKEIVDLTVKRKSAEGAGVTPGNVHLLLDGVNADLFRDIPGLSIYKGSMKDALRTLPPNDVIVIPPKKSEGTVANGMLVEKSASDNGLQVGGSKSGGVISCLINGPRDPDPVVIIDGGYSTSTILWYGV